MSLLNRRLVLLAGLAPLVGALSACGFTPAYGTGGSARALQNRVLVDAENSRNNYLLVRELEERFGRATSPTYGLALTIQTEERPLAIDPEGNTRRFNLLGSVDFALRDLRDGTVLTSGKVDNFTGYSATGTTVATLAAQTDAQDRLMNILAEEITTRLIAADIA